VKGEPIVETPEDAIKCFLSTGMEYLVLHDLLLAKKRLHRVLNPIFKARSEIAALVQATLAVDIKH
jgi:carbamoyltransferase